MNDGALLNYNSLVADGLINQAWDVDLWARRELQKKRKELMIEDRKRVKEEKVETRQGGDK